MRELLNITGWWQKPLLKFAKKWIHRCTLLNKPDNVLLMRVNSRVNESKIFTIHFQISVHFVTTFTFKAVGAKRKCNRAFSRRVREAEGGRVWYYGDAMIFFLVTDVEINDQDIIFFNLHSGKCYWSSTFDTIMRNEQRK